jgi:hypothetical protein
MPSPKSQGRSQNWAIAQLPGLSPEDCQKLTQLGITTTLQLVRQTQTPQQQQQLAAQLAVHLQHVQKWAALANLARVPSVGCQYCGLLLYAGIATPQQLATTPLPRLHRQLMKLHVSTLQRNDLCPSLNDVATWIQDAQHLLRRP